ncbi:hypothetical protein EV652_105385 [Kribbella steppae]|uniref:Uncharacterized protein n=1 Tax=Kribbella steppae TaxID=2512223 RepID=A0A4R2HP73_9ACTN|nr:hypothetical protein [Kribbella steppae]TCO30391.1 hypothetical protein EV652_105385 [Kribbella steppae]
MTAQHNEEQPDVQQAPESTDPLGPITLPTRSKIGARAMALVGTVGLSAFAAAVAASDLGSTWPTIES